MVDTMTERTLPPRWWWWYAGFVMLLALVGVLLGMNGIYTNTRQDAAATAANEARDEQNAAVLDCVTEWVEKQAIALQERDAINRTTREAQREMWTQISKWMHKPGSNIKPVTEAIDRFREILRRLERVTTINPYPEFGPCFDDEELPRRGNLVSDASAAGAFTLAAAYTTTERCWGRRVTIRGTRRNDTLSGTDGDDVIFAGRGSDLVSAGRGTDYICAGRGNDTINGGPGRDSGRGGMGRDLCIQVEDARSC